jgi:ribosome-associated protein
MSQSERRPRKRTTAPRLTAELKLAVAAALDKKAEHVIVLDLRKSSAFTDHFLICTGANVRQVQAIAEAVQEALRKTGVKPALVEGATRSEWVLIDYFDFIVHVFTPGSREFYDLERLWGDAEPVPIPGTPDA